MTDDELADFLTKGAAYYNERRTLVYDPMLTGIAIRELAVPNLLSIKAIAAIVGCSEHAVLKSLGPDASRPRGKLNPAHIPFLGYLLSTREIATTTLNYMLDHGTSLSTIADLTNVSQATLYRWRHRDGD